MELAETFRYDMNGVLLDISYPSIASEGDEIHLSMSMQKERAGVNVKRISLTVSARLQDGSIWSQRNYYHGNLREKATAKTIFSVPYGLEHNHIDVQVKVEYTGRNGTAIVKHGKIMISKTDKILEDKTKIAKDELESKLSEIMRKMELLESSNMKLVKQVLDLEDRMNEPTARSESASKQTILHMIRSVITRTVPVRIEVDKSITNYVKENPGSPFILGFMGLLVGAAVKLSIGDQGFANELAVYAYYALVIGVVTQIVKLAVRRESISDFKKRLKETFRS